MHMHDILHAGVAVLEMVLLQVVQKIHFGKIDWNHPKPFNNKSFGFLYKIISLQLKVW